MKRIHAFALLILSLLTITGLTSSCEFNSHEDPDHPLYVEYTISAGNLSFSGPQQLLLYIQNWIKENQIVYVKQVNYSTGDASEFSTTDAEAIKKYEEFLPKFKALFNKLDQELAKGTYGKENINVNAIFYVFAKRAQGKDGNLKYDQLDYVYPSSN